jgi:hypothetical protein
MTIHLPTLAVILLTLAGCSGEAESSAEQKGEADSASRAELSPAKSDPVQSSAQPGARISAEYLVGPWCYRGFTSGDFFQEQNINFIFHEDGTLLYQNSERDEIDRPGSWSINGDAVSVMPIFMSLAYKLKTVEPDKFVLSGMGDHIFTRGSCDESDSAEKQADTPPGVEALPFYVRNDGEGILRYSVLDGEAREYWLAQGLITGRSDRPFEPLSSDWGPFIGPDIAVYFSGQKRRDLPLDRVAWMIYEKNPFKAVAYFKPEINPEKAETKADCGAISFINECSNKRP